MGVSGTTHIQTRAIEKGGILWKYRTRCGRKVYPDAATKLAREASCRTCIDVERESVYAWRDEPSGAPSYVAHLPGDSGVDWGYTGHSPETTADTLDKPIKLSPYWQRRFSADMKRVGKVARFSGGVRV